MHHQDWEPVVFRKKTAEESARATAGQRAVSQLPSKQVRDLMNDTGDSMGLKYFEKQFVQSVITKRVAQKWSQADLANRCNVPVARIQNLERGKEVYDPALRQKITRTLAIN